MNSGDLPLQFHLLILNSLNLLLLMNNTQIKLYSNSEHLIFLHLNQTILSDFRFLSKKEKKIYLDQFKFHIEKKEKLCGN